MPAGSSVDDRASARPTADALAAVARAATGRSAAVASRCWREPVDHVIGSWGTAALTRVRGVAAVGAETVPWSAVVKVLHSPRRLRLPDTLPADARRLLEATDRPDVAARGRRLPVRSGPRASRGDALPAPLPDRQPRRRDRRVARGRADRGRPVGSCPLRARGQAARPARGGMPVHPDVVRFGFHVALVVRSAFSALVFSGAPPPGPLTSARAGAVARRVRLTRHLVDLGLALPPAGP